jgi:large subunit ribosomal protein L7/L12|eukprot:gene23815-gene17640
MNQKIDNIIEELKSLSLLETVQLIEQIEKTFDVTAAAGTSFSGPITTPLTKTVEAIEEKTAFDIILNEVPADKKIAILKVIRNVTGLGLKESKDIVDNVPKVVKEGITKEESENIKKELEGAGGKVIIK